MTQILIVLGCLILNALFAAVEMAFVTIGKPELRNRAKNGEARAKNLLEMRENPEKALSVIQIGITLVGAISAAVSGAEGGRGMILSGLVSLSTSYRSLLLGSPGLTSPEAMILSYDVSSIPSCREMASWQPGLAQLETIRGNTLFWKYTVSVLQACVPPSIGVGGIVPVGSCLQEKKRVMAITARVKLGSGRVMWVV